MCQVESIKRLQERKHPYDFIIIDEAVSVVNQINSRIVS